MKAMTAEPEPSNLSKTSKSAIEAERIQHVLEAGGLTSTTDDVAAEIVAEWIMENGLDARFAGERVLPSRSLYRFGPAEVIYPPKPGPIRPQPQSLEQKYMPLVEHFLAEGSYTLSKKNYSPFDFQLLAGVVLEQRKDKRTIHSEDRGSTVYFYVI